MRDFKLKQFRFMLLAVMLAVFLNSGMNTCYADQWMETPLETKYDQFDTNQDGKLDQLEQDKKDRAEEAGSSTAATTAASTTASTEEDTSEDQLRMDSTLDNNTNVMHTKWIDATFIICGTFILVLTVVLVLVYIIDYMFDGNFSLLYLISFHKISYNQISTTKFMALVIFANWFAIAMLTGAVKTWIYSIIHIFLPYIGGMQ